MATWAADGAEIVLVCATRGEAGQIRDATVAVRRTLGQVREAELRKACACLGVHRVIMFDYIDGTLHDVQPSELAGRVEAVLREVDPDVVITFGEDGAYGHPDHIAIGDATAQAVDGIRAGRAATDQPGLLFYRSHFPANRLSLAERLAAWLIEMESRFDGSIDYGQALTLFAEESTTMRFASDDVRIEWFPRGSLIVEQGELGSSLYLILSGSVVVVDDADGDPHPLRTMREGQFFGELGVAGHGPRSASVIAIGNVTCLVLSPAKPTKYAGRGGDAVQFDDDADDAPLIDEIAAGDVVRIDVSARLDQKLAALASHRSQYPIDVDAFPRSMLNEMYGTEYFTPC
ncbi:MAG: LmbE family protein [Ilumatobacteraceae bacterium]|nr:LmbE family protein [Ilumatobacteraceae bacterium]